MVANASPDNERIEPPAAPAEEGTAAPHSAPRDVEATSWPERLEFLRGLADIVEAQSLSEASVESAGVRYRLKAPSSVVEVVSEVAHPVSHIHVPHPGRVEHGPFGARDIEPEPAASDLIPIVTPMVGVFYRAPSPSDPNFVEVGDRVEIGQTVGLVEAMKVFNEIVSEIEGTAMKVLAQSGDLVETGSTLLLIKPG